MTNKRMQVQVTSDSAVGRLSPAVVQMLAARIQSAKSPGTPPAGGQPPKTLQSAIEELPPLGLASLKPGDALILSCTKDEAPSRTLAITLLAGVEPLFKTSSKGGRTLDLGSWNLDFIGIFILPAETHSMLLVDSDVEDDTFKDAGRVGVWTKADSVTYFDDLQITVQ